MKQERKSSLYIVFAGILWGTVGLFIKKMAACGLDSFQITFTRMGVSGLFFAIYLFIFDRDKFKIDIKDVWMFIGTGLLTIFLHNVTLFYAIINGEASVACVLVNSSPIFIMIASAILFKERITTRKIIALSLTVTGCIFVSGVIGNKTYVRLGICLIAILSGFLYGMYTIFSRYALKKYSNKTINIYTYTFAFLGGLFIVDVPSTLSMVFSSARTFALVTSNGVVTCMLPFIFYTAGLKYVENSKASILVSFDPIVSTLVGIFFLHESSSPVKLFGILLILISIVILNTKSNKLNCSCQT